MRVPNAHRCWPHAPGEPALHESAIKSRPARRGPIGRCFGFRPIAIDRGPPFDGIKIVANDAAVFARAACWTSAALVSPDPSREVLEPAFCSLRSAGMNITRVGGTMLCASGAFYGARGRIRHAGLARLRLRQLRLSRRFGILRERSAGRDGVFVAHAPDSLTVMCGGSEVDQRAAMPGCRAKQDSNASSLNCFLRSPPRHGLTCLLCLTRPAPRRAMITRCRSRRPSASRDTTAR